MDVDSAAGRGGTGVYPKSSLVFVAPFSMDLSEQPLDERCTAKKAATTALTVAT